MHRYDSSMVCILGRLVFFIDDWDDSLSFGEAVLTNPILTCAHGALDELRNEVGPNSVSLHWI